MVDDFAYCPVCDSKTRTKLREDTELKNYPLHCPKCKNVSIVNAEKMKVEIITTPVAVISNRK